MADEGADIGSKLDGLLSDPDMMAKVMTAVRGLAGNETHQSNSEQEAKVDGTEESKETQKNAMPDMSKLLASATSLQKNRSVALLQALQPFLSKPRQERAEQVLKIIRLAEVAGHLQDFM